MKNIDQIKERYLKESFNMRLGHLASDLARISTFSDRNAIEDLIEESKFFIEWSARDVSFDLQVMFSEMQLKLALWHRRLKKVTEIKELNRITKEWSRQLLEVSGLLVV